MVPQSPPSLPRRITRSGRAPAGRMDGRGGIDPAGPAPGTCPFESLRCPPSWGPTQSRGGHGAPWVLDTTSRTSQTRPAARRASAFVRSSPAPPPCGLVLAIRRLPGIGIKPPTGPAGASQAPRPLACPSPYLLQLLPLRPLPPSLAFDSPALPGSGSPQTRPRPAHGPTAPAGPPQTPSKHAPLTPPQAVCGSGKAVLGAVGEL